MKRTHTSDHITSHVLGFLIMCDPSGVCRCVHTPCRQQGQQWCWHAPGRREHTQDLPGRSAHIFRTSHRCCQQCQTAAAAAAATAAAAAPGRASCSIWRQDLYNQVPEHHGPPAADQQLGALGVAREFPAHAPRVCAWGEGAGGHHRHGVCICV
eukprot:473608-Pelagomonas_calceolata.AAC.1